MSNTPTSPDKVPFIEVTRVPVEWLKLDAGNPRLTGVGDIATDEDIIAHLYRAEDLGELLQSIAANGYMDIEPFIVWEEEEGYFTVLEGHRSLGAIRLFREPGLAGRISKRKSSKIQVPAIPEEHRSTLGQISVYRVAGREDAASFIGFKHINGAARWSSYAKAKFAARWYKEGDISLAEISNHIGDRHATVKRMVNAVYVLEQAEAAGIFDIEDRTNPRFSFSHLYTALARPDYRKYFGLDATKWSTDDPRPNPVPDDRKDHLAEVLKWIYGSKRDDVDPVVKSQNPDIRRLGAVLESSDGLAVLRASQSLDEAHDSTQPAGPKFLEALLLARRQIREALHHLRGFDGQDTSFLDIAEDV